MTSEIRSRHCVGPRTSVLPLLLCNHFCLLGENAGLPGPPQAHNNMLSFNKTALFAITIPSNVITLFMTILHNYDSKCLTQRQIVMFDEESCVPCAQVRCLGKDSAPVCLCCENERFSFLRVNLILAENGAWGTWENIKTLVVFESRSVQSPYQD